MSYQQYQNYQQPQVSSTANSSMYWNGSQWVTPPQQQLQQQAQASKKSLVELYTEYYHGWQACLEAYKAQYGADKQQNIEWAMYYADQSSRAAHYYYEHELTSRGGPPPPPPPFDLPPAPPPLPSASATGTSTSTNSGGISGAAAGGDYHQRPAAAATINTPVAAARPSTDSQTPGSLTSYVQRSLGQCLTSDLRAYVQAQVEKVIAQAIQQGNLHTKNWNLEPLIALSGVEARAATSTALPDIAGASTSTGRGRGVAAPDAATAISRPDYGERTSYYGPASATLPTPTTNPSSSSFYSSSYSNSQSHNYRHSTSDSRYSTSLDYYSNSSSKQQQDDHEEEFISLSTSKQKRAAGGSTSSKLSSSSKKKMKTYNFSSVEEEGLDRSSHALTKRQERFAGPGGLQEAASTSTSTSQDYAKYMGLSTIGNSSAEPLTEQDFERMTVKGTCQLLEKDYLRLTAPPRAELVRPLEILKLHLYNLQKEYYGSDTKKKHDYLWFCSQLKAVRQDLTIQRIQNDFAVKVYETHARIALVEGDLNEFNQCQTQLKELYSNLKLSSSSSPGNKHGENQATKNEAEFVAYRLLYHVLLTTTTNHHHGTLEITQLMYRREDNPSTTTSGMEHALKIRHAVATTDYVSFFRLHHQEESSENKHLGKYFTGRMVPTMRLRALKRLVRVYRPSLPVEGCSKLLGFHNNLADCRAWMESCGAKISEDGTTLLTKESDGADTIHEPQHKVKNSLI